MYIYIRKCTIYRCKEEYGARNSLSRVRHLSIHKNGNMTCHDPCGQNVVITVTTFRRGRNRFVPLIVVVIVIVMIIVLHQCVIRHIGSVSKGDDGHDIMLWTGPFHEWCVHDTSIMGQYNRSGYQTLLHERYIIIRIITTMVVVHIVAD